MSDILSGVWDFLTKPNFGKNDPMFDEVSQKVAKMNRDKVLNDTAPIIASIPIFGPLLDQIVKLMKGDDDSDTDSNQVIDLVGQVASQYATNPEQQHQLRKTVKEIQQALTQLQTDYNRGYNQLMTINQHIDDYVHGVQKQAMINERNRLKAQTLAMEDEIASQTKKLISADYAQQTINDLSMTPVTAENDAKVEKIASDMGIELIKTDRK